jgi:hypothetical protein
MKAAIEAVRNEEIGSYKAYDKIPYRVMLNTSRKAQVKQ